MAKHFTKQEIDEIRQQLATYGVRDSEFPEAETVASEDEVMILQDEKNKRLDVGKIENKIYTKIHDEGIDGQVLSDNNYTTGEKNKLAGIASGAQVNVIEKIKQDGVLRPIAEDKSVNIDLSDFVHKNLVPPEASSSNKLADKAYVHNEIVISAATFRGTSPKGLNESQFLAWANTREHDLNDYVYWDTIDANDIPIYKRYKWDGTAWVFEYVVNNSDFSDAQLAAINSGIDTTRVDKLDALPTRSELTGEFAEKQNVIPDLEEIRQNAETGGNAYHLPVTGIPKTDMSEGVQTSLGKADTAIQDVSDKVSSDDYDDIIEVTQEEFDALQSKDPRAIYIVTDSVQPSDHVGIASLEQTTTSIADEGINIWTCTLTNGNTYTLQVKNGHQGNSGYTGAAGELEVVNNLTDGGSTAALSAEMGKELNEDLIQLGQEVNGLPVSIVNQVSGINSDNPSIAIFQNFEPTSTKLGTSIQDDTESPFRDLVGKKTTYFRAQNATQDKRYITDGLFSGATTNKVVFSYWVKKSAVLADSANCVFLFSLWQTSSWNDTLGFSTGLKGLINGGVGNTVTYTRDTGSKLKSVRTIKFAYELDGWCQIVQTHNLSWYDTTLTIGVGVMYETAYPASITIVNPQIILNADAPIGKYVIKDVATSIAEYPEPLIELVPKVAALVPTVAELSQEVDGLPIINQITGINTNSPNYVIFQNNTATSTALGITIGTDSESPFRDLVGKKTTYFRAQNATGDKKYVADGIFSGATTNKVVFSYWVKKSDVLADTANCVFLFSLWQTSSWNDTLGFNTGLKGLINGGVGTTVSYTRDTGSKLKSVREIKFAYELDGWCQIVQTHNLTWYDTTLTIGIGVMYETAYPSRFTIVNPQIIINADAPIGKYVIKDVADTIKEYPDTLMGLIPRVATLEDEVKTLLPEKGNVLHLTFTEGQESYILSPFSETHLAKLYFYLKRALDSEHNRCFNFARLSLVNKQSSAETVVNSCVDDIAPLYYNGSYIGANHAIAKSRKLTIAGHGLSYSNIGEVWNYGDSGEATILGIIDANNIIAIGKQMEVYPIYDFDTIPADAVLSKNGTTLSVTASVVYQWYCATDVPDLDVFVDGNRVTQDGDYPCIEIKVCEAYDIYNVQSVLEKLRLGVGTYTDNPNPASFTAADRCTRLTNTYFFHSAEQWFVATTLSAFQNIDFVSFGFTQQGALSSSSLYIPKTLPVSIGESTIDFRTCPAYPAHSDTVYITSETSETPNLPPDRWLAFNTDIAIHSGLMYDFGVGGARRKDVVDKYFYLPSTLKIYPRGIDNKISIAAGDSYSAVAWRTYLDRSTVMANGVISVNKFVYANCLYIYADFYQAGIYEIEIPEDFVGKTVDVFEKRDNVTLLNPISGRKVLIKVDSASPMYGYFVAKIK